MTAANRTAVAHHYKRYRRHQLDTYGISVEIFRDGVDQRQFTGGGAAYGWHAYAAYLSAKSHLHFVKDLGETVARNKQRSAAARRGWKTRRATAS
jgi:hypothetical protein